MKIVSERVSILKEDDLLSIVVLPDSNKKKLFLLFLWLLAWSVCGIIVFFNYFKLTESNAKLFVIVYLSFWLYFEYRIIRVFMWKRAGREKLWIKSGILYYQREVNGRGKINEYHLELIGKMKLLELNTASFSDFINQSFWIKGGERLEMPVQSRFLRVGMQLTDQEALSIIMEVNSRI